MSDFSHLNLQCPATCLSFPKIGSRVVGYLSCFFYNCAEVLRRATSLPWKWTVRQVFYPLNILIGHHLGYCMMQIIDIGNKSNLVLLKIFHTCKEKVVKFNSDPNLTPSYHHPSDKFSHYTTFPHPRKKRKEQWAVLLSGSLKGSEQ